jgi:hypothetical protein
MLKDCRGLSLTTVSEQAAAAFDHATDGYLGYRADMAARMDALAAEDAGFGLAHCLRGYLTLMSFRADTVAAARAALADARRSPGSAREMAHAAALSHWIEGDPDAAVAVWEQILAEHPLDILAFRLAHFVNFWAGRPEAMLASVLSVERHWSAAVPGYTAVLACRCFAHEEAGYYTNARKC